ncbi:Zn-finger in Ran binding protein, partial [Musa troglodytarum]
PSVTGGCGGPAKYLPQSRCGSWKNRFMTTQPLLRAQRKNRFLLLLRQVTQGKEDLQVALSMFVNCPSGTDEIMLADEFFGTIGLPKVWGLTRNKVTNEPKGYPTITYEDPHAALAAVEWFHNKDFHGAPIEVHIVESKAKDLNDHSYAQQNGFEANSTMVSGVHDDVDGGGGRARPAGAGGTGAVVVEGGAVVVVILQNVPVMLVVLQGSLVQMIGPVQWEAVLEDTRNLMKKRKRQRAADEAQSGQMVPGSERAGWVVDEIVMTGRHGMDKSRDRYRDSNERESSKNQEIDGPERERR